MFGTFKKTFSQVAPSQGVQFPKRQLPKGYVMPCEATQVAIGGRALRLGWAKGRAPRLEQDGGRVLWLRQTWKVAAWEIALLGSCLLGKYYWEVATWEKSLGKYVTSFKSPVNMRNV